MNPRLFSESQEFRVRAAALGVSHESCATRIVPFAIAQGRACTLRGANSKDQSAVVANVSPGRDFERGSRVIAAFLIKSNYAPYLLAKEKKSPPSYGALFLCFTTRNLI